MALIPAENKRLKKKISRKFYKGNLQQPRATTVGRLIKILEQLPKGMKLNKPHEVVVYNINFSNPRVGVFEED